MHRLPTSKAVMEKEPNQRVAMWMFLERVPPPQEQHQAGPSGGVLEEGVAVTDDDISTCVTTPGVLPVGQDVDVGESETAGPDPVQAQARVCLCLR